MNKRKLALFLAFLSAFGLFFALLFSDIPSTPREGRLLEIPVIVRGQDSKVWASVKQGVDQAARDLNVNVSFITLTQDNDTAEQAALLARELSAGADAILLGAADSEALLPEVERAAAKIPVVAIDSPVDSPLLTAYVAADNGAMGRALGEAVIRGGHTRTRVLVLQSRDGHGATRERADGFLEVMNKTHTHLSFCSLPDDNGLGAEALRASIGGYLPDALVAFDAATLELGARVVQEAGPDAPDLFGIGATGAIASYLEQGVVRTAVVPSGFSIGYLGLKAAADAARRTATSPTLSIPVDYRVITGDNMYLPENQKLLFPFVR